ncbi:MAG: HAD family hydrolase [Nitrospirae bacterium]|nr:MAG: HAD family hydrolase [Nitrospirota bacterium]
MADLWGGEPRLHQGLSRRFYHRYRADLPDSLEVGRVITDPGTARLSAVLFDFGGTLDADGVAWKERFFRLWCEEAGAVAPERFAPAFYAADDAVVGAVPPTLSFRETVRRITQGIAREMGAADSALVERVAARFVEEAVERLRASALVLDQLSRRYRLGIVSNFYGNLSSVCEEVGLSPLLAVMVDSACVGCVKPDPRIFQAALTGLNAKPEQAVFIGDSLPRDMAGAKGIGMPHIWLTPETTPAEKPCCTGDRVIHALEELRHVL